MRILLGTNFVSMIFIFQPLKIINETLLLLSSLLIIARSFLPYNRGHLLNEKMATPFKQPRLFSSPLLEIILKSKERLCQAITMTWTKEKQRSWDALSHATTISATSLDMQGHFHHLGHLLKVLSTSLHWKSRWNSSIFQ